MCKIIYLGKIHRNPMTGGQKYNSKVLGYLKRSGFFIIECEEGSSKMPFSPLRIIAMNIGFVRRVMPLLERDTFVLEDVSSNLQTILLNLLMLFRRKGVMVGICHHLFVREKQNILLRAACYAAAFCMLRYYDAIVTVSNSTKRDLVRFGAKEEKVHIIPNATEAPQTAKREYNQSKTRLLFVGTYYPRKGIIYLIQAVGMLKNIHVDIIGNSRANRPYMKQLKALARSIGSDNKIVFHDSISPDDLWEYYRKADIFVLPSLWEGFGIVFLEAMSFGLPIVSTNIGAIPEIVKHEKNGLLVRPKDPRALASSIDRLVASPSLRQKLGQNGFKFMQDHKEYSSWDAVGEQFKSVVQSLRHSK